MITWSVLASGGITWARHRLGYEPMKELFAGVAVQVAERRHEPIVKVLSR